MAIKITFAVIFGIFLLTTVYLIWRSGLNQLRGLKDLNRRRIIFKYDISNNNFIFMNKTHLLDNKEIMTSFDLLDYVHKDGKEEANKMVNFLSNVSRNTFLFKETKFNVFYKDKLAHDSIGYSANFKIRVDNIIYGVMTRVGGMDSKDKIEISYEFEKTYKNFEEEINNSKNNVNLNIFTIEPIIENDISFIFDEKSVHNINSVIYEKVSKILDVKKIPFYIDRNRRISFACSISQQVWNDVFKVLKAPIKYQNMFINLSFRFVNSNISEQPNSINIRECILKNMFLLTESKKVGKSRLTFDKSNVNAFEKFLSKVDGIQDVFEKSAKTIEYKPYLYSKNSRIVGYSPMMDLYGDGFKNIKEYFPVARCVQLEQSLFSILMERIIFDFFNSHKNENAVLFLPVPFDMIEKFLSLQNILSEKMEFSKDKLVIMLFEYRVFSQSQIISQTKVMKKMGFNVGFHDVKDDQYLSTIEETKPTFRSLGKTITSSVNNGLYDLTLVKKIKEVSNQESSFMIIENISSFEQLQTFVDNGIDIVSGEYIYLQNNEFNVPQYVPTDIQKIHKRNKYL